MPEIPVQGIIIIAVFVLILAGCLIADFFRRKKQGQELQERYAGKHVTDFKYGGLSGFIAEDTLVFKCSKGYFTIDLKQVKSVQAYSVNGGTYVTFADENNKPVIKREKLGMLGTPGNVKKFLEMVCKYADWIQWL